MSTQHLMNCTYETPSTSKLNLISKLIARIHNVEVVITICLCQDQDRDISLWIYDLILDSVSVFCEFSHLSHQKKPVQQVQRVFLGRKMQFHLDWVLSQLFFKSSCKWSPNHLPHKFDKNEIPLGWSFNTTIFKEKQNQENPALVLVTLLISMVHGAATLVGGEPRGLEHVEFGMQDRWLPPVTSFEDFSTLLDWSCGTVEKYSITSLNFVVYSFDSCTPQVIYWVAHIGRY